MTVGFIGLGLIGGSIAKAIRDKMPDTIIVAYNRNQEVLKQAILDDVVDIALPSPEEGFSDCDIIFICVPVIKALDYLPILKKQIKPTCILTDVGSTKTAIHKAVEEMGLTRQFIGGHPMTGSEKTGYANGNLLLLENAYYMLTPTDDVDPAQTEFMRTYIADLGSLPLVLNYEQHDRVVAGVSHLPHLISASLVNLVHEVDAEDHLMKTVAAGGFRDITRISSSSPEMWQEICLANGPAIVDLLDRYITQLTAYRDAVKRSDSDELLSIFTECKEFRDSFSSRARGEYRLYCDVADEYGAIARIAGLLAENGISIKNIGVVHNREFEEGVLQINFYDRRSMLRSIRKLKGSGYTIYES
ncbi:MAG: prephenate dehydrogenase [Lachnospiraceae bacterium]|nr:prephenate dehydrogenase [Lachnospiraceae bacterium]